MKIEKHNYQRMILTPTETEALGIVDRMLERIYNDIFSDACLTSQLTGECFIVDEIARIRGILGFFENGQIYEVSEK